MIVENQLVLLGVCGDWIIQIGSEESFILFWVIQLSDFWKLAIFGMCPKLWSIQTWNVGHIGIKGVPDIKNVFLFLGRRLEFFGILS